MGFVVHLQLETTEPTGANDSAMDAEASRHKCLGDDEKDGLAAMSPTRSLILKVVIACLIPPFCGNFLAYRPIT